MKTINNLLKIITIIGSIYYSIPLLETQNIYGILVKLSIIPLLFLPQILRKILKIKLSNAVEFLYLAFLFSAHFLGSIVDFYHKVPNYDTWMHFISGFLVSLIATYILKRTNLTNGKHSFFCFIFILCFSTLVASMWEYMEFFGDKIFGKDAQNVLTTGVDDTMKDMIVAFLASILYGILFLYEQVNHKKGITTYLMDGID